jgi:hypothetical protein
MYALGGGRGGRRGTEGWHVGTWLSAGNGHRGPRFLLWYPTVANPDGKLTPLENDPGTRKRASGQSVNGAWVAKIQIFTAVCASGALVL